MRVCFVCLGNICRSPAAEAVLGRLARDEGVELTVDSAGTADYHVGREPHEGTLAEGRARGYAFDHTAWQFAAGDFAAYDLVVALDASNEADLRALAPDAASARKVVRLGAFLPGVLEAADVRDIADPWGLERPAFTTMYDHLEAACRGLLDHIRSGTVPDVLEAYAA